MATKAKRRTKQPRRYSPRRKPSNGAAVMQIRIRRDLVDRLKAHGSYGDDYSDMLERVLDAVK